MNLTLRMTLGRVQIHVRGAALGLVQVLAPVVAPVDHRLVVAVVAPVPVVALMDVLGNVQVNVQGHAVHRVLEIVLMLVTVFAHLVEEVAKMLWRVLCRANKINTI